MVSAAKLRRAQDAIFATRPYARRMYATLGEIGRRQRDAEHALLKTRSTRGALEVVVVTSDRGLCGAFNAGAIRAAEKVIAGATAGTEKFERVVVSAVGRKAAEYFGRRRPLAHKVTGLANVAYADAAALASQIAKRFESGETDRAVIVYNEFVSALTQRANADTLLPLSVAQQVATAGARALPFDIEPDARSLLDVLVPQALEFAVFRALLESQAGEHAARMTAMESATRNTEELIRSLTLSYNRARQAAITRELVEIVSGAEAL